MQREIPGKNQTIPGSMQIGPRQQVIIIFIGMDSITP
jgi:hypothetical protein